MNSFFCILTLLFAVSAQAYDADINLNSCVAKHAPIPVQYKHKSEKKVACFYRDITCRSRSDRNLRIGLMAACDLKGTTCSKVDDCIVNSLDGDAYMAMSTEYRIFVTGVTFSDEERELQKQRANQ